IAWYVEECCVCPSLPMLFCLFQLACMQRGIILPNVRKAEIYSLHFICSLVFFGSRLLLFGSCSQKVLRSRGRLPFLLYVVFFCMLFILFRYNMDIPLLIYLYYILWLEARGRSLLLFYLSIYMEKPLLGLVELEFCL